MNIFGSFIEEYKETVIVKPLQEPLPQKFTMPSISPTTIPSEPAPTSPEIIKENPELVPA